MGEALERADEVRRREGAIEAGAETLREEALRGRAIVAEEALERLGRLAMTLGALVFHPHAEEGAVRGVVADPDANERAQAGGAGRGGERKDLALDLLHALRGDAEHDGLRQLALAGEEVVDRADGELGLAGDLGDRGAGEALGGEDALGGVEDGGAMGEALLLSARHRLRRLSGGPCGGVLHGDFSPFPRIIPAARPRVNHFLNDRSIDESGSTTDEGKRDRTFPTFGTTTLRPRATGS